jgi:hypothetical protein
MTGTIGWQAAMQLVILSITGFIAPADDPAPKPMRLCAVFTPVTDGDVDAGA